MTSADILANNYDIKLFFILDRSLLRLKVWSNISFNQFLSRIRRGIPLLLEEVDKFYCILIIQRFLSYL